jgi:hypothetical protein
MIFKSKGSYSPIQIIWYNIIFLLKNQHYCEMRQPLNSILPPVEFRSGTVSNLWEEGPLPAL